MRGFALVFLVLAVFAFSSCSSVESIQTDEEVTYSQEAPSWIDEELSNEETHYTVGYAKMSNQANSIRRAQAEAKSSIANWVNTAVENVVASYVETAGEAASTEAIEIFESLAQNNTTAILNSATEEDRWISSDGGVYVLMAVSVDNVEAELKNILDQTIEEVVNESLIIDDATMASYDQLNATISNFFASIN